MGRVFFISCALLSVLGSGYCVIQTTRFEPHNPDARPWSNDREKVEFMFLVSDALTGSPVPDHCVDLVERELERRDERDGEPGSIGGGSPQAHLAVGHGGPASITLVQESSASACRNALASCGNCHLPRENNCTYNVTYTWNGKLKRAQGRVLEDRGLALVIGSADDDLESVGAPQIVPKEDIVHTEWINGGDAAVTWWDFHTLSGRGDLARRMLAISAENDVACTNCHLRHGDFRLTEEGREFFMSGRIIRRIPLSEMTR